MSREMSLKKIREIKNVKNHDAEIFKDILKKSLKNISFWNTESEFQKKKIVGLYKDLKKLIDFLDKDFDFKKDYPFNDLYVWCEKNLKDECIEYAVSTFMEPYDDIINPFIYQMSADEDKYFTIPAQKNIENLRSIIEKNYSEILKIDFSKEENNQNFWFISKNKEEPRLADRYKEQGAELEQPLAIARDIARLYQRISNTKNTLSVGKFLIENNDLRHAVRRVFISEFFPYSEIQDNTIGSKLMPIDMLRLKLSFFGAVKFDPRSDKWLRICMFQGAPLPNELQSYDSGWIYNSIN